MSRYIELSELESYQDVIELLVYMKNDNNQRRAIKRTIYEWLHKYTSRTFLISITAFNKFFLEVAENYVNFTSVEPIRSRYSDTQGKVWKWVDAEKTVMDWTPVRSMTFDQFSDIESEYYKQSKKHGVKETPRKAKKLRKTISRETRAIVNKKASKRLPL